MRVAGAQLLMNQNLEAHHILVLGHVDFREVIPSLVASDFELTGLLWRAKICQKSPLQFSNNQLPVLPNQLVQYFQLCNRPIFFRTSFRPFDSVIFLEDANFSFGKLVDRMDWIELEREVSHPDLRQLYGKLLTNETPIVSLAGQGQNLREVLPGMIRDVRPAEQLQLERVNDFDNAAIN